jgi:hypothetical protein
LCHFERRIETPGDRDMEAKFHCRLLALTTYDKKSCK